MQNTQLTSGNFCMKFSYVTMLIKSAIIYHQVNGDE